MVTASSQSQTVAWSPCQPNKESINPINWSSAMQSLSSFRTPDVDKTLGIELECVLEEPFQAQRYIGFFYVTTDGSIMGRDGYGREFVSQPLPSKWLKKELDRLQKKIPQYSVNDSCGIHVHASRKWVTPKRLAALTQFFKDNIDGDDAQLLFGRRPNQYCRSLYQQHYNERYYCINSTNPKTVEFRMFASGSIMWAKYCVDMVEYLITNAYHLNPTALYAASDLLKKQYNIPH